MQFKGSSFTWWNGKADSDCIFESLSRIPYNQEMQGWFNYMEVEHLDRTGSDHAPILLTCDEGAIGYKKSFRFLKFWTENASFVYVVR